MPISCRKYRDWLFFWRMQRQRNNSLAVKRGEGGEEQKNGEDKEGRNGTGCLY